MRLSELTYASTKQYGIGISHYVGMTQLPKHPNCQSDDYKELLVEV